MRAQPLVAVWRWKRKKNWRQKSATADPKGWPEVYALEQIELAAEPQRELKLQALKIGDVAIAAIPNEVSRHYGSQAEIEKPAAEHVHDRISQRRRWLHPHRRSNTSWAAIRLGRRALPAWKSKPSRRSLLQC